MTKIVGKDGTVYPLTNDYYIKVDNPSYIKYDAVAEIIVQPLSLRLDDNEGTMLEVFTDTELSEPYRVGSLNVIHQATVAQILETNIPSPDNDKVSFIKNTLGLKPVPDSTDYFSYKDSQGGHSFVGKEIVDKFYNLYKELNDKSSGYTSKS